jgi:uncharacterized membrane protein YdcZ (DUF606 family)
MDASVILLIIGGIGLTFQNGQTAIMSKKCSFFVSIGYVQAIQMLVTLATWGIDSQFSTAGIEKVPLYAHFAGVANVLFLYLITDAIIQIGNAIPSGCMLSAQTLFNILIDEMGWFGFEKRSNSVWKSIGISAFILSIMILSIQPRHTTVADKNSLELKGGDTNDEEMVRDVEETKTKKNRLWITARSILFSILSGIVLGCISGFMSVYATYTTPSLGAFTSASSGTLICLLLVSIQTILSSKTESNISRPSFDIRSLPWWVRLNGLFSAFYFLMVSFVAPRYGAQLFFGIVNTCQLVSAVLADHFMVFGFGTRASIWQVVGSVGILGSMVIMLLS